MPAETSRSNPQLRDRLVLQADLGRFWRTATCHLMKGSSDPFVCLPGRCAGDGFILRMQPRFSRFAIKPVYSSPGFVTDARSINAQQGSSSLRMAALPCLKADRVAEADEGHDIAVDYVMDNFTATFF